MILIRTGLIALFSLSAVHGYSQVSISYDGLPAHSSAILDLRSSDEGFLIPRMPSEDRQSILSPAQGLIVFDTSTGSFWYFDGTQWREQGVWSESSMHQIVFHSTETWQVPDGVFQIMAEVWGGGGGGAGYFVDDLCLNSGGGGGGGGYSKSLIPVTPGSLLYIYVGEGGVPGGSCSCDAGTPGMDGTSGQNSSVLDSEDHVLIYAGGGHGGQAAPIKCSYGLGGAGGAGSGEAGIDGMSGTDGVYGTSKVAGPTPFAGFGGSAGGPGGSGGVITPRDISAAGQAPPGMTPGGGGSASNSVWATGGTGAPGRVVITY